jgi:predicted membrane channel-forming protein YqfA (hemolysin III family)
MSLLIAGTYTPFLAQMKSVLASTGLGVGVWLSAIIGIAVKLALSRAVADLQRIIERMAEGRMGIELRTLARQLQQLTYNSTMRMDG